MIQLVVALAIAAVAGGAGFVAGVRVQSGETQGWIEQAAALEAQVHQMKTDGDARARRAEAQAKAASAELARVKKEAEADRAKWIAEATDGWSAYLDSQRVPVAPDADAAVALAACRSDEAAARGAVRAVLDAALGIRAVAVLNTEQLRQLQLWIREVSQ